jgi:BirA family transcriptional regulator, biotin operon repressor / biotin---[acetyl-CoA-carboxylase] ligase
MRPQPPSSDLSEDAIAPRLRGRFGRPYRYVTTCPSTQRLLAADDPEGAVAVADEQTEGRGRLGRRWEAPPGTSLLVSLLLRPDVPTDELPTLSPVAGQAVADAIAALSGVGTRVKLPNDVLVGGRKVAGVLVEGRPQERWAIAGIGVNAALDLGALPTELRATAGTLGLAPRELDAALQRLLTALTARIGEEAGDTLAALRERDALLGAPLRWNGGTGTGAGVTDDGALRVRLAGGEERLLHAGEVHLA